MGRRTIVVVLAVLGVLLAALAVGTVVVIGDDETPSDGAAEPTEPATPASPTPTELPPGIHLSFIQQRFDEGTRRSQLRVVNNTGRTLHVDRLGVDWAGYPTGLQRADYDVPAGWTIDLRFVLPRPDCASAAGAAPAYAVITTPRQGRVRQPMPDDGMRYLDRLWQTTCNEQRVRRTAEIAFSGPWSEEGSGLSAVLHGRLLLTRQEGVDAVTVDQVQGSVLFELSLPGETVLAADADRVALPLDISPGRCDEHGRSQSTQTFLFRVWFRLGESDPLSVVVTPTGAQQVRLLAFLDRVCG